MTRVSLLLCMFAILAMTDPAEIPKANSHSVTYTGTEGPGVGKHIVFIAGDHEYRSEEILPAMARIMAKRYGFTCTVFFTLDDDGFIEPGSSNMAGLVALESADLLVAGLRFQDFPDDEMQHIVDYLDRGGPVYGIRTSTHAFRIKDGPYRKYSWDYEGAEYLKGFGRQVLGETWVSHHGTNHEQSSQVLPASDQIGHPIFRGVDTMHAQSGGYFADPIEGSTLLAFGVVLNGMDADSSPDPDKAVLPVAWTRNYKAANGQEARVFTTTHGASEDFLNNGFRRMMINAAFWTLGMESSITADNDISFVGPYNPVTFSFGGYRRGVRPADMDGWDSPIMSQERATTDDK
jgi:type 1 glutamine amidotransferase